MTKLAALLSENPIQQKELARKCGVTPAAVNHWVLGNARISATAALIIADILGVEPKDVIGDVETPKRSRVSA